jgi:hypothetical protein
MYFDLLTLVNSFVLSFGFLMFFVGSLLVGFLVGGLVAMLGSESTLEGGILGILSVLGIYFALLFLVYFVAIPVTFGPGLIEYVFVWVFSRLNSVWFWIIVVGLLALFGTPANRVVLIIFRR